MKTYILQYMKNGVWCNYLSDDKTPVEFVSLNHAKSVGMDLCAYAELYPFQSHHWQIVSSTGEKYTLSE